MKAVAYISTVISLALLAAFVGLGAALWQSQATYSQMAQAYSSCSYQLNVSRPYGMRGKKAPGLQAAR